MQGRQNGGRRFEPGQDFNDQLTLGSVFKDSRGLLLEVSTGIKRLHFQTTTEKRKNEINRALMALLAFGGIIILAFGLFKSDIN